MSQPQAGQVTALSLGWSSRSRDEGTRQMEQDRPPEDTPCQVVAHLCQVMGAPRRKRCNEPAERSQDCNSGMKERMEIRAEEGFWVLMSFYFLT